MRLLVSKHSANERHITGCDGFHTPQMALPFSRLLRQDVIPEGLSVLIAFSSFFKPLGSTTTGFQFWHFRTPHCSGLRQFFIAFF